MPAYVILLSFIFCQGISDVAIQLCLARATFTNDKWNYIFGTTVQEYICFHTFNNLLINK